MRLTKRAAVDVPAILAGDWILNFNPTNPHGKKRLSFLSDGYIGEGKNKNEFLWKLSGDVLEIYQLRAGLLQNRFHYEKAADRFVCTNDDDAVGNRGQSIYRPPKGSSELFTCSGLVRHAADHFSPSPNALERELRKRLVLGELIGIGYGFEPSRGSHAYPSVIPKDFWKVADLKVREFLTNPDTPSEVMVANESIEEIFGGESAAYKPQGDECKLYENITFKADDVRRLWP